MLSNLIPLILWATVGLVGGALVGRFIGLDLGSNWKTKDFALWIGGIGSLLFLAYAIGKTTDRAEETVLIVVIELVVCAVCWIGAFTKTKKYYVNLKPMA